MKTVLLKRNAAGTSPGSKYFTKLIRSCTGALRSHLKSIIIIHETCHTSNPIYRVGSIMRQYDKGKKLKKPRAKQLMFDSWLFENSVAYSTKHIFSI